MNGSEAVGQLRVQESSYVTVASILEASTLYKRHSPDWRQASCTLLLPMRMLHTLLAILYNNHELGRRLIVGRYGCTNLCVGHTRTYICSVILLCIAAWTCKRPSWRHDQACPHLLHSSKLALCRPLTIIALHAWKGNLELKKNRIQAVNIWSCGYTCKIAAKPAQRNHERSCESCVHYVSMLDACIILTYYNTGS